MKNISNNIIYPYLQKVNTAVSKNKIAQVFDNEPFNGTLYQLNQTFNTLGISNLSIQVTPNNKDQVFEIPIPFLSHLKSSNEFILINEINDKLVNYVDEHGKKVTEKWEDFEGKWSGIALLAFPQANESKLSIFDKSNLNQIVKKVLLFIIYSVLVISVYTLFVRASSLWVSVLLIVKMIGIAVSIILLQNKYNKNDSLVNRLCSVGKNDCNKVLKSEESKLFGLIEWSELGFIYFMGGFLTLIIGIFSQNLSSAIFILMLINIPTLAFSFYSIWYQNAKAKSWCVLCLISIGLFWIEAILMWNTPSVFSVNNLLKELLNTGLGFSIPLAGLMFIKPLFEKANELKKVKKELYEIKFNDDVVDSLFQKKALKASISDCALTFNGDDDSTNVLTIITNPTCPPCSKAHNELEKYFNGCYEDLRISLIFTINPELDKDSEKYKVAERIVQLYKTKGKELALKATNDWYEAKNFEKWDKKYRCENMDVTHILKSQHEWCIANNIDHTPTVLFNNRELPREYKVEDIRYLMN